jgi:basic membrane lipoprotein Med (substrate-binding protein (PBP1-ABC) superfamily)
MSTTVRMPGATQNVGPDEQLTWLTAAFHDLHHRATALERLVDSGLRLVGSVAQGDGPAVVTVRVDRDAWFTAVDAATTPRPEFPGTTKPKATPPG